MRRPVVRARALFRRLVVRIETAALPSVTAHGGLAAYSDVWVTLLGSPDPELGDVSSGVVRPTPIGVDDLGQRVRALLAALGPVPGAVEASLRAADARAGVEVTPVGRYLSAVVGTEPDVRSVACDGRTVNVSRYRGGTVSVGVPPAVATFLEAFDQGCYPALGCPSTRSHGAEERPSTC